MTIRGTMTTIIYIGMTMTAPMKTTVSMTTTKTMVGGGEKPKSQNFTGDIECTMAASGRLSSF